MSNFDFTNLLKCDNEENERASAISSNGRLNCIRAIVAARVRKSSIQYVAGRPLIFLLISVR